MNIVKQIPAYLLAIAFVVFGLNYWLKFIPMEQMPGDAGTFVGIFYSTGYLAIIKVFEVTFGTMLLFGKTRPLGLILIAPICVGILLFEICVAKQPSIGVALVVLNAIGIWMYKQKYVSIVK